MSLCGHNPSNRSHRGGRDGVRSEGKNYVNPVRCVDTHRQENVDQLSSGPESSITLLQSVEAGCAAKLAPPRRGHVMQGTCTSEATRRPGDGFSRTGRTTGISGEFAVERSSRKAQWLISVSCTRLRASTDAADQDPRRLGRGWLRALGTLPCLSVVGRLTQGSSPCLWELPHCVMWTVSGHVQPHSCPPKDTVSSQ
jgi:hypothetical protein